MFRNIYAIKVDFVPANYDEARPYELPGVEWVEDACQIGMIPSTNGWNPELVPRDARPTVPLTGRTDGTANNQIAPNVSVRQYTTRAAANPVSSAPSSTPNPVINQAQASTTSKKRKTKLSMEDTPPPAPSKKKKQKLIMSP